MQKIPNKSKFFKNDGHFQISRPKISFKQFSNICENVVNFFFTTVCKGVDKWLRIFAKQKNV